MPRPQRSAEFKSIAPGISEARARPPRDFLLVQGSVLAFVVGHDVVEKQRESLGDKRAQDDPVRKLDGHFVFRRVERLVHAEEKNDLRHSKSHL